MRTPQALPCGDGLYFYRPGYPTSTSPDVDTMGGQLNFPFTTASSSSASSSKAGSRTGDLTLDHSAEIARHYPDRVAYGAPLNCTFRTLEEITALVKSTGVHRYVDPENKSDGAYYAVATAVVPYPSGIYSVWVYALLLVPKRPGQHNHHQALARQ